MRGAVGGFARCRPEGSALLVPTDLAPDVEELMEGAQIRRPDVIEISEDEGPMDPIDARDDFDGPSDIPAVDLE